MVAIIREGIATLWQPCPLGDKGSKPGKPSQANHGPSGQVIRPWRASPARCALTPRGRKADRMSPLRHRAAHAGRRQESGHRKRFMILASLCRSIASTARGGPVRSAAVHELRSAISRRTFGEEPAIEKVHYFGFVLPDRQPLILFPLAHVVRSMRPALVGDSP
jgi:hypothetical protein